MKEELFLNYQELQSERLLLRKLAGQDVSDVFEIYSDPEVMLYFDDRYAFEELSEAEQMICGYNNAISSGPVASMQFLITINGLRSDMI